MCGLVISGGVSVCNEPSAPQVTLYHRLTKKSLLCCVIIARLPPREEQPQRKADQCVWDCASGVRWLTDDRFHPCRASPSDVDTSLDSHVEKPHELVQRVSPEGSSGLSNTLSRCCGMRRSEALTAQAADLSVPPPPFSPAEHTPWIGRENNIPKPFGNWGLSPQ
jgi:hypothetical protein